MDIKSIVLSELTKQVEATVPQLQSGIESFIIEKINGQVQDNKTNLTKITTVGFIGILIMPVIVSIIMRVI